MSKFKPLVVKIFLIGAITIFPSISNAQNNIEVFKVTSISWKKYPSLSIEGNEICNSAKNVFRTEIMIKIDKKGSLSQSLISKSSGNSKLDKTVLEQIKNAKANPFMRNGKPINGVAFLPVAFYCR